MKISLGNTSWPLGAASSSVLAHAHIWKFGGHEPETLLTSEELGRIPVHLSTLIFHKEQYLEAEHRLQTTSTVFFQRVKYRLWLVGPHVDFMSRWLVVATPVRDICRFMWIHLYTVHRFG